MSPHQYVSIISVVHNLRENGSLSIRHVGNPTGPPYPAHSTHPDSSTYDFSSSSVDIQGIHLSQSTRFSNPWITPKAGSSEGPTVRHIPQASHNESLEQVEQPAQGNLDTPPSYVTVADSCGSGKRCRRTTIDMLSEDTILEIFDFYRLDTMTQRPWMWHHLAHVCRKWRHVLSVSPRRLDLHILCEYGSPIGNILRSWPTLPLVVRFDLDSSRESEHLPRNVVVALRHPDRLCSIDLEVTSSMTGSIVEVIQKPCQALGSIRITVRDSTESSILVRNAFLGGSSPHLREIKLDGIAFPFPAIQQVLLSTNNLVELHLSKIPNDVYFSPEDLVTGLSTLVQLKRLTFGFLSPDFRPPSTMTRPARQRASLPSLAFLAFHGMSEYLEEFVARIDFPVLSKILIKLFNDILFEIPQFCELITRLNTPKPLASALVTFYSMFVKVTFSHKANILDEYHYTLRNSCRRLDWQLSFVTQITSQLSPFLFSVHELAIQAGPKFEVLAGEDVDSTQWLELFQPFTHVTKVTVWAKQLVPGILQALVTEDMAAGVLPELTTFRLYGYPSDPSVVKAAEQFVVTRRLSGHRVDLKNPYDFS